MGGTPQRAAASPNVKILLASRSCCRFIRMLSCNLREFGCLCHIALTVVDCSGHFAAGVLDEGDPGIHVLPEKLGLSCGKDLVLILARSLRKEPVAFARNSQNRFAASVAACHGPVGAGRDTWVGFRLRQQW